VKVQTLFVSVFALALLEGCDSATEPGSVGCPPVVADAGGIHVSVLDSASGAAVGNAVTATAIDGKFFDAISTPDLPSFVARPIVLVQQTAGKYDLYVSKAGYRPWVTRGLVVSEAACGLTKTVNVTAKLQT
jgi:hypothetical protein